MALGRNTDEPATAVEDAADAGLVAVKQRLAGKGIEFDYVIVLAKGKNVVPNSATALSGDGLEAEDSGPYLLELLIRHTRRVAEALVIPLKIEERS